MRFFVPILVILVSCHLPQKASLCQLEGKVIHNNQLDGCSWLIQTSDGRKLLPQNGSDFHLSDQQMISLSYIPFDGMSICMAEDEIVTLTCLQTKAPSDCPPYTDWQEIPWMLSKVDAKSVTMIQRYTFGRTYLYSISGSDSKVIWYNCQGQQICNQEEGCDLPENNIKDPVTIFLAQR